MFVWESLGICLLAVLDFFLFCVRSNLLCFVGHRCLEPLSDMLRQLTLCSASLRKRGLDPMTGVALIYPTQVCPHHASVGEIDNLKTDFVDIRSVSEKRVSDILGD